MFLVPEPCSLIFQNKKIEYNAPDGENKIRYDSLIQLPQNDFKNSWKITFQLKLFQESESTEKTFSDLYFGMNALRLGLIDTAEYFFKNAALKGSIEAMNMLGKLYIYQPNKFMFNREDIIVWFRRAFIYNDIKCLMNLTDMYNFFNINETAMFYGLHYFKHFKNTRIVKIIYENMNDKCPQLRNKLDLYCLANGLNVNSLKHSNLNKPVHNYVPMNYNEDVLNVNDLYNSLEIKYDNQQIKYETSVKKNMVLNDGKNNNNNKYEDCQIYILDCSCKPLLVSNNGTMSLFLLKIFRLASAKFEDRNLLLCKCYINKCFGNTPKEILETTMFKNKSENGTHKDLISCGFIAFLVGDFGLSIKLFKKASEKGNIIADELLGIFLFHDKKTQKQAMYHLLKASTCFISLSYLYLSTKEDIYLSRLKYVLEEEEEYKIFESIGDIFWNGIKLPENKFIAKIFYGISLAKHKDYTSISKLTSKLMTPL